MAVDPNKLAEKIALKANAVLQPALVEMTLNNWPMEFRKIMWDAIADTARALANETMADARPTTHKGEGR